MITDIPSPQDFEAYGIDYLNLAWEEAVGLLRKPDEFEDKYDKSDFWKAAQRPLAMAISLCHQGIEFLLKAQIATISPFLLISKGSSEWPKGCDKRDTPFPDFHTVDAQDIVKIYNTVYGTRLAEDFIAQFENLRKLRNTITHTVNKNIQITVKDILLHILNASSTLTGKIKWLSHRRSYLDKDHDSVLYSSDENDFIMLLEMKVVVKLLGRSELLTHFGFDKRRRKYQCPVCYYASSMVTFDFPMAVIEPNTPKSTTLYCFICDQSIVVERKACMHQNCKGNVISVEEDMCLTCTCRQE